MPETFHIPGFVTPGSPKADDRMWASPDGQVVFNITMLRAGDAVPAFEIIISQDFGGRKVILFEDTLQINLFAEIDPSNTWKYVFFYCNPTNLNLHPGSYGIEALLNGVVVKRQRLNIPARQHSDRHTTFAL